MLLVFLEKFVKYYDAVGFEFNEPQYFKMNGSKHDAEVERIATAKLNRELKVSAQVEDPSGIQQVVLRYRRVSQFEDYQSIEMVYNAYLKRYEAVITAQFFDGNYDVMYYIEAIDTKGNGRMYPDMETETI